ncbi:tetratricopeptide repeat protein [Hoylesella pleuritidis]|uniref:tetratricopeptide repeat protein n=1 Tax=Hoylesella pleuritidis TaxID=407975 RepID=UPI0028D44EAA|nr:tetratricopeptide repeat protein [Hoylesella pleuritidis]
MKKIITLWLCLFIIFTGAKAQSSAVKNVAKSVFTLTTFKQDGSILASSRGIFVDNRGTAISTWTPFVGAAKAVVVDAKGNKQDVEELIGANELYDVCKFRVKGNSVGAPLATSSAAPESKIWLVGYSLKAPEIRSAIIKSKETFMQIYTYYILSTPAPDNATGSPYVNQNGQVLGLLQHSTTNSDVYATDARFINSFTLTGLSVNDPVLNRCGIRTEIPDKQEDALLTLMLANDRRDSLQRMSYVNAFIRKFPMLADGYTTRAQIFADANQFSAAASEMETAIRQVTRKDEAHSSYAKVIYQKEIYKNDKPFAAWSLDKALDEARKAYEINPQPLYLHQQAQIIYAQGDYQKAYDLFLSLTKTPIRNGELYYEAAQCKSHLKAPKSEIMALLDSAVAACPQPLNSVAAPYVLARGAEWEAAGDYRKAIMDYNLYDSLMLGRPISSQFYYTREQCEVKIRHFQQALNDIARAILMTPNEPTYWAEKASLHLRVNQFEDAVRSARHCIELAPKYADAYIVLGVALMQSKDKTAGLQALQKAKDLGDERADALLKKYK